MKRQILAKATYSDTNDALHITLSDQTENRVITNVSSRIPVIDKHKTDNILIWRDMEYNQGGIYLPALVLDISIEELTAVWQKKPLGRPIGSLAAEPLDNLLRVRYKTSEKGLISQTARASGMKLSEFVRQAAIEKAGAS